MENKIIEPQDDTDRLKRVAFWYWEYMRRNQKYRRYCQVMRQYNDYFKMIGVYDFMQTKEFLDEMFEYVYSHDELHELKYTPFRKRLERAHGEEAGRKFFKFGFWSCGFDKLFGRIYKDCDDGLDSEYALDKVLSGGNIPFFTEDVSDIAALIKLNSQWGISVAGSTPCVFTYDLELVNDVKIDPKAVLDNPAKIGLEAFALNLITKSVESLFEKQNILLGTYESVYKLSLAGKHINSSDIMRLSMLWLWDKAHEENENNPLPFDTVYPLLKAKIEGANAAEGVWEQLLYRKPRIREYYESTSRSIQQLTIIPLKSK
jgi:hypothetical protein